jgi:hypothetical protein
VKDETNGQKRFVIHNGLHVISLHKHRKQEHWTYVLMYG